MRNALPFTREDGAWFQILPGPWGVIGVRRKCFVKPAKAPADFGPHPAVCEHLHLIRQAPPKKISTLVFGHEAEPLSPQHLQLTEIKVLQAGKLCLYYGVGSERQFTYSTMR